MAVWGAHAKARSPPAPDHPADLGLSPASGGR